MPDTQYFTNIDGKYVKDAEARQQLNDLEDYVESLDQPWTPLQDGYSNFWFELTDDTLSPWLNFSAKTENAVIDWGDGSGEVALDTLTPTHTYSKAGKYVVKVKGVTGIARQNNAPYNSEYLSVLKYVELNSDVTSLSQMAFLYCVNLMQAILGNNIATAGTNTFNYCTKLKQINIPASLTVIPNNFVSYSFSLKDVVFANGVTTLSDSSFYACVSIVTIQIPSSVTEIKTGSFRNNPSLNEIHIQATVPPTLGDNVFIGIASNYIIYVPVGTAETYKAASGWSTYADHILEEGQTPNRAMLAKFNSAKTEEVKDDELYKDENR